MADGAKTKPITEGGRSLHSAVSAATCDSQNTPESSVGSDVRLNEMEALTARLERVLTTGPKTLAAIEGASARSEELLRRLDEHWQRAKQENERLTADAVRLDQTCASAQKVEQSLASYIRELSHAGDATQQKVSLLLECLEGAKSTRESLASLCERAKGLTDRLAHSAAEQERRVQTASDGCLKKIEAEHRAHWERTRQSYEQMTNEVREGGLHAVRLRELVDRGAASLERTVEEQTLKLQKLADEATHQQSQRARQDEEHLARVADEHANRIRNFAEDQSRRLTEALDAKSRQLSSQISAAREGVRMLGGATKEAHDALTASSQERETAQHLVESLTTEAERCGKLVADLRTGGDSAQAVAVRLGESLEKADSTTDSLEGLLRDGWSLSATVQDRTRLLSERCQASSEWVEKMEASRQAVEERSQALVDTAEKLNALSKANELASERSSRLEAACRRAGNIKRAVEENAAHALEAVKRVNTAAQRGREITETVDRSAAHAQASAQAADAARNHAQATGEQLVAQTLSAERLIQEQEQANTHCLKRIEQVAEARSKASRSQSELTDTLLRADTAADDVKQTEARATQIVNQAKESWSEVESLLQKAVQTRNDVSRLRDTLVQDTDRFENVLTNLTGASDNARTTSDRLITQTLSAECMIKQWQEMNADEDGTIRQLRETVEHARSTATQLAESARKGDCTKADLADLTQQAVETSSEMADLLASVVERKEILDGVDENLGDAVERFEALAVRIQQLQTRSDSLAHQLNGMLADPRKVIDEAKTQAIQLDTVCRSVRKVFAGLSQTSLQANRDIARFGDISREAEGKLAQLAADTHRATQALREWVDEAAHAQSRLSKTLAQVPSVGQTHPPEALINLGQAAMSTIPDILKPGATQRRIPAPGGRVRTQTTSSPTLRLDAGRGLATVVREDSEDAKTRHYSGASNAARGEFAASEQPARPRGDRTADDNETTRKEAGAGATT